MAITVGTDTYATIDEADDFLSVMPVTNVWNTATVAQKEAALKAATRIIDLNFTFKGKVANITQPLVWPRSNVSYFDDKRGHTVTIADTDYPDVLKYATIEQANHIMTFPSILVGDSQTFERIKIGPIEVEDTNADISNISLVSSRARQWLKKLLYNENEQVWWRRW